MGICTSATVEHSDYDNGVELTRVSHFEKDCASLQIIRQQQDHVKFLTTTVQQLKDKTTSQEKRIEKIEENLREVKAELENAKRDLSTLKTNKDNQAGMKRQSTDASINIQHADTVYVSDTALHA